MEAYDVSINVELHLIQILAKLSKGNLSESEFDALEKDVGKVSKKLGFHLISEIKVLKNKRTISQALEGVLLLLNSNKVEAPRKILAELMNDTIPKRIKEVCEKVEIQLYLASENLKSNRQEKAASLLLAVDLKGCERMKIVLDVNTVVYLSDAIRDGAKMIKANPQAAQGYLRKLRDAVRVK